MRNMSFLPPSLHVAARSAQKVAGAGCGEAVAAAGVRQARGGVAVYQRECWLPEVLYAAPRQGGERARAERAVLSCAARARRCCAACTVRVQVARVCPSAPPCLPRVRRSCALVQALFRAAARFAYACRRMMRPWWQ